MSNKLQSPDGWGELSDHLFWGAEDLVAILRGGRWRNTHMTHDDALSLALREDWRLLIPQR